MTSPQEVEIILQSLKIGKAVGQDSINNRILNELAKPLSVPLHNLNYSFSTGTVSNLWKKAKTPVFMKGDPSDPSNYGLEYGGQSHKGLCTSMPLIFLGLWSSLAEFFS